mmetsp:Transcript_19402/g.27753  ORF Transcript_19402/g.27753 Transcript_19402/m.27753 type:complete len:215 (-) Transcript_19402:883-1527(-)
MTSQLLSPTLMVSSCPADADSAAMVMCFRRHFGRKANSFAFLGKGLSCSEFAERLSCRDLPERLPCSLPCPPSSGGSLLKRLLSTSSLVSCTCVSEGSTACFLVTAFCNLSCFMYSKIIEHRNSNFRFRIFASPCSTDTPQTTNMEKRMDTNWISKYTTNIINASGIQMNRKIASIKALKNLFIGSATEESSRRTVEKWTVIATVSSEKQVMAN